MKYCLTGHRWGAKIFPLLGLVWRARHPLRKLKTGRLAHKRKPARVTTAGSRCRAGFAQLCSLTILAMPGTLPSLQMGLFMSTPGAAAITATIRLQLAVSC